MSLIKGLKGTDLSADKFLIDESYFDPAYENSTLWGTVDPATGAWVWSAFANEFWKNYKANLDQYINDVFAAVPNAANPSQAAQDAVASQSYNLNLYNSYRLKAQQVGIQNHIADQKTQLDQETLGVTTQVRTLKSLVDQANATGQSVAQVVQENQTNLGGLAALAAAAAAIYFYL